MKESWYIDSVLKKAEFAGLCSALIAELEQREGNMDWILRHYDRRFDSECFQLKMLESDRERTRSLVEKFNELMKEKE